MTSEELLGIQWDYYWIHPFDRMLIYQCIKNEYIFVSKDTKIETYKEDGLEYIW
jgi:PIN domain nuclease of toxin-antitoxin system